MERVGSLLGGGIVWIWFRVVVFLKSACAPVIKNAAYIFKKTFSTNYLRMQWQRLCFGCALWYS